MSNLRTLTKSATWETTHHGMIVHFSIFISFCLFSSFILFYNIEPGTLHRIPINHCILHTAYKKRVRDTTASLMLSRHIAKNTTHATASSTRPRALEIGVKNPTSRELGWNRAAIVRLAQNGPRDRIPYAIASHAHNQSHATA